MRKLLLLPLLALLVSCALTQSFSGKVAAGYAAVAATNDTTLVLVNAGEVSKEEGRKVYEKTHAVLLGLDAASQSGNADAVATALTLLREAQAELCKGKESNPNCALLLQPGVTP